MTDPSRITAGEGARRPPRSWLHTDAPTLDLTGLWRFRLLPAAPGVAGARDVLSAGELPEAMADPEYDDSSWDEIPVPAHWVLVGDGRYGGPMYTNTQYPFPVDPPHVPDQNPTGDYRRTIDLPDSFAGAAAVVLRFEGVESRYTAWLNGIRVGLGAGSRLPQEFDVTDALRPGRNCLAVRVHQWSADSYLEDQDQWWLPGIFREVTLQARPIGGIEDVWLRAGFTPEGTGWLAPQLTANVTAYPITLSLPALGVHVRWAGPEEVCPLDVGAVEPWSTEAPRLYDAGLASSGETVSVRIGFRSIQISDGRFRVNGSKVVFRGVNRHESDPDHGRVFDEARARADLVLMKQHNINAIRTAHYPPHPRLLDLADELGFWVILECDLETHGFEKHGWVGNPSDDPAWRAAYLDRIERTVERDKNHPSIVMWSLGNESGTGENLAAMAAWVHDRDGERPVHYEGDHAGRYTDVYARMYAPIAELEAIGDDSSRTLLLGCTAAESARQRTKPFLLSEYGHAMGNGPGGLDQYDELFRRHPRLHGGFVWEWRDHGIRTHDERGTEFYGYGGDFGEVLHDGNFVMDGLVLSDGTPTPSLLELKQVYAPVRLGISRSAEGTCPGGLALTITNRRHTLDTADLVFRWRVERDGWPLIEGVVEVPAIAAGGQARIPLPVPAILATLPADAAPGTTAGAGPGLLAPETWLTVEAVLAEPTSWAPAAHCLVFAQYDLTTEVRRPGALPTVRPGGSLSATGRTGRAHDRFVLGPAEFEYTRLVALAGRAVGGTRLELWRAPTDNDRSDLTGSYEHIDPWADGGAGLPAPSYADTWRAAGLDRLVGRVEDATSDATHFRLRRRWSAAEQRSGVVTDEYWHLVDGDLWLRVEMIPTTGWDLLWPRVGIRLDLPGDVDGASWFGTGPLESYPDSHRAARVGRFTGALGELTTPYGRPQESGHRSGLRSLTLTTHGVPWLRLDATPDAAGRRPGFTLTPFTAQQLDRAAHPHELIRTDATYLYVDAAQNGLGSRSCGPDVWPDHMLRPRAATLLLRLRSAPD